MNWTCREVNSVKEHSFCYESRLHSEDKWGFSLLVGNWGSEAEFRHIYRGYLCWQFCLCGTSVSRQQFGLSAAYEIVYECDSFGPCCDYAQEPEQNSDYSQQSSLVPDKITQQWKVNWNNCILCWAFRPHNLEVSNYKVRIVEIFHFQY